MSRTRIVILRLREVIFTAVFVGLGIILLIMLITFFMSGKGKNNTASIQNEPEKKYEAGIYTKELTLGESVVDIQLALDETGVKAVELVNLSESVETMYPLMKPTVKKLSKQLAAGKSMDEVVISEESQYTEKVIVDSVSKMLEEHTKEK